MPGQFHEVAIVPEGQPMDLWSAGGALYLTTGGREGFGSSRIFRHVDSAGDASWVDDGAPSGAETINKIRNTDSRIYAFFETGGPWLISKPLAGAGGWGFEGTPESSDFVGGQGLDFDGETVIGGG